MKRVNATIQINFLCMLLPPPFCAHKTTLNQFIRNWQKSFSIFLQKKTKRTKIFFFFLQKTIEKFGSNFGISSCTVGGVTSWCKI